METGCSKPNLQTDMCAITLLDEDYGNESVHALVSALADGANCLYMDGHVKFNKYVSDFPVTTAFAKIARFF